MADSVADEERKHLLLQVRALVNEDPEQGWDKAWCANTHRHDDRRVDFRPSQAAERDALGRGPVAAAPQRLARLGRDRLPKVRTRARPWVRSGVYLDPPCGYMRVHMCTFEAGLRCYPYRDRAGPRDDRVGYFACRNGGCSGVRGQSPDSDVSILTRPRAYMQ